MNDRVKGNPPSGQLVGVIASPSIGVQQVRASAGTVTVGEFTYSARMARELAVLLTQAATTGTVTVGELTYSARMARDTYSVRMARELAVLLTQAATIAEARPLPRLRAVR